MGEEKIQPDLFEGAPEPQTEPEPAEQPTEESQTPEEEGIIKYGG